MENRNIISLKQFQRTTGISDRALIVLLSESQTPAVIERGQLMIDITQVATENLIAASKRAQQHHLEPYRQLFIDRFADLVHDSLEDLLDAALDSIPQQSNVS